MITLAWIAAPIAVLLVALVLFQDRLLYLPAKAPLAQLLAPGLLAWPGEAEFRGLLAEPAGNARGTVLVFHGNAGHAGHRSYYAAQLAALGFRTVLVEYPGYGPRAGSPGEAAIVDDAVATLALARQSFPGPIVLLGESLGAAVAAAAAARHAGAVHGLILITPWDRLENVAAHHYPWLPVRTLLRERYDSAAGLAGWSAPVLVVVAAQDEIVPAGLGRALFDALPGPKHRIEIAGASHNDWPTRVDSRWWREATDFAFGSSR